MPKPALPNILSQGQALFGGNAGPGVSSPIQAKPPYIAPCNRTSATSTTNAVKNSKSHTKLKYQHQTNKRARTQPSEVQELGYRNFEETPVEYWEPKRAKESDAQHNARRKAECANMKDFIEVKQEEAAKAKHDLNDSLAAENEALQSSMLGMKDRIKNLSNKLEIERIARAAAEKRVANVAATAQPDAPTTEELMKIREEQTREKK